MFLTAISHFAPNGAEAVFGRARSYKHFTPMGFGYTQFSNFLIQEQIIHGVIPFLCEAYFLCCADGTQILIVAMPTYH